MASECVRHDYACCAYRHWLYHWLLTLQVEPASQVVGPVQL